VRLKTALPGVPTHVQAHVQLAWPVMVLIVLVMISQLSPISDHHQLQASMLKSDFHADTWVRLKTVPPGVPTLAQAHVQLAWPVMVLSVHVTISQLSLISDRLQLQATSTPKLDFHADTWVRLKTVPPGVPTHVQAHVQLAWPVMVLTALVTTSQPSTTKKRSLWPRHRHHHHTSILPSITAWLLSCCWYRW